MHGPTHLGNIRLPSIQIHDAFFLLLHQLERIRFRFGRGVLDQSEPVERLEKPVFEFPGIYERILLSLDHVVELLDVLVLEGARERLDALRREVIVFLAHDERQIEKVPDLVTRQIGCGLLLGELVDRVDLGAVHSGEGIRVDVALPHGKLDFQRCRRILIH